jgi:hypothetical protein
MLKTHHLSVAIAAPPEKVYAFASEPANFPRWVTSFVHSIQRQGEDWLADTKFGPVTIRFTPQNPFGILDHVASPAPGVEIHVPMRVIANGEESEVLFTLFQQPGQSVEEFARDRAMVERDLATLKCVVESLP